MIPASLSKELPWLCSHVGCHFQWGQIQVALTNLPILKLSYTGIYSEDLFRMGCKHS